LSVKERATGEQDYQENGILHKHSSFL